MNTLRLLLLLFPILCFSQHTIFNDSLYLINLNQDELVNGIKVEDLELIQLNRDNYFIDYQGGNVFVLTDLELKQIDNSFRHKMQVWSNIFNYNDTIYRHGGYGFWETRNLLTFYDFTTKEWEILKSKNKGGRGLKHLSTNQKNKSIFFGGYTLDETFHSNFVKSNSVYLFDFRKKEWTNLGNSKYHFTQDNRVININDDKKVIIKNDTIFLIEPFENKIKFYKSNKFMTSVRSSQNLKSYYKDSTFYFINSVNSSNEFKINQRSYDEVFSNKLGESSFISHDNNHSILLIGLLIISLLCLIFYLNKKKKLKKKTLNVSKNILIYKKRKVNTIDFEMDIIHLLNKNSEVKISDVRNVLNREELDYNHQLRIVVDAINNLNNKITVLMDLKEPFIKLSKSNLDKRVKIYSLNNNVLIKFSNK